MAVSATVVAMVWAAATVSSVAGQSEPPFGVGGRIEVPESRFAITFPDDWGYFSPTGAEIQVIEAWVQESWTDETAAAAFRDAVATVGPSVALLAFPPSGVYGRAQCLVFAMPSAGETLEQLVAMNQGPWIGVVSGPTVDLVLLPSGDAARFDATYAEPATGVLLDQAAFTATNGSVVLVLSCMVEDGNRPEDDWLSVASSIEFLPSL